MNTLVTNVIPMPGDPLPVLTAKLVRNAAAAAGQYGVQLVATTDEATGPFGAITALTDIVFTSVTAETSFPLSGSFAGVTVKAGASIFGRFASFKLASGTAVGYILPRY
jgi:hypothetical protein